VPSERFLGDGTRSLRGGGGREISNAARLGVNAVAPPRWPMGKKTGRVLCPQRATRSALRGRIDDQALRYESRLSIPDWTDRRARAIRALRMTWDSLDSTARSGRTFLARSCRRIVFSGEKRVSPFLRRSFQNRTTKRRGLRHDWCHAALLVLSRPPRAAFAVASGQPGQRSAARQTPHIPFFFQNVWSAVRLQVKAETKEESLRKCIRPLLEINISWARMSCARARPNKMDGHRRPF
jgi:hypothetical protein